MLPAHRAGQLTDQPLEEFSAMLHGPPTAHFLFAKHVLPALKQAPSSSYLFISEGAGESSSLFHSMLGGLGCLASCACTVPRACGLRQLGQAAARPGAASRATAPNSICAGRPDATLRVHRQAHGDA